MRASEARRPQERGEAVRGHITKKYGILLSSVSQPLLRSSGPAAGDAVRDLSGHVVAQRYQVECCLGAGAMGSVWRVQHVESLQWLALKALH